MKSIIFVLLVVGVVSVEEYWSACELQYDILGECIGMRDEECVDRAIEKLYELKMAKVNGVKQEKQMVVDEIPIEADQDPGVTIENVSDSDKADVVKEKPGYDKVEENATFDKIFKDARKAFDNVRSGFMPMAWPDFAQKYENIGIKEMLKMYEEVRLTDAFPVRISRDFFTREYKLDPGSWLYVEMTVILATFILVMLLPLSLLFVVALLCYFLGESTVWIVGLSVILKSLYRLIRGRSEAVNEYYVEYNERTKNSDVSVVTVVLLMSLVAAGVFLSNYVSIHLLWVTVLLMLIGVLLYSFPTVVQKSVTEGAGIGVLIVGIMVVTAVASAQIDLPKWYATATLRWKYPMGDIDAYSEGYRRLDNAGLARDIAVRMNTQGREFLIHSEPMGWDEALTHPYEVPVMEYTAKSRATSGATWLPYWIATQDNAVNSMMLLISTVGMFSMFLLMPMGAVLMAEGERREQNMAARARDGGQSIDSTPSFLARMAFLTTGTAPLCAMLFEYLFVQWVCGKWGMCITLLPMVPIGVMIATYFIDVGTGKAWMDIGGAPHRGVRNTAAGIAFIAPGVLQPFENATQNFLRWTTCGIALVSAYFAWSSGGYIHLGVTLTLGVIGMATARVAAIENKSQIWTLITVACMLQFYGAAAMFLFWKLSGRNVVFFRHHLHHVANPVQIVDG